MQKIVNFFLEARAELAKVSWPSRQTLLHYTVLVVMISVLVAIFLGTLDSFFGYLVNRFLLGV